MKERYYCNLILNIKNKFYKTSRQLRANTSKVPLLTKHKSMPMEADLFPSSYGKE